MAARQIVTTKKNDVLGRDSMLRVAMVSIDKLQDATYNPRKISAHDLEELKKSLKKFKAVEPAVVNMSKGREYVIIGGHQRIKAARELGWTEYPCTFVQLSLKDEKELNIRLNRNGGEWDFDKLMDGQEFKLDELKDFGFEDFELEGLDDIASGGNLDVDSMFNQEALDQVAEKRANGEEFDRGAANRNAAPSENAGDGATDGSAGTGNEGLETELGRPTTPATEDILSGKKVKICALFGKPCPHANSASQRRK